MAQNTVIRTNVLALNAHRNLGLVATTQARSSQRLSSGYRINSAADDAAGLAISEKMRAQIRGLNQADRNTQDAISLIQTAEGGMQEIDNMVQRIRELVVYASNDHLEYADGAGGRYQGDRQKIQNEINQLMQEIDSMASRVEFNRKRLIDGSFAGPQLAATDIESMASAFQAISAHTTQLAATQAIAEGAATVATNRNTSAVNSVTSALGTTFTTAIGTAFANVDLSAAGTVLGGVVAAFAAGTLSLATVESARDDILAELNTLASDHVGYAAAREAVLAAFENLAGRVEARETATANARAASAAVTAASAARTAFSGQFTVAANAAATVTNLFATETFESALSAAQTADPALTRAQFEVQFLNNLDSFFTGSSLADVTALREFRLAMDAVGVHIGTSAEAAGTLWFQLGANAGQGFHMNIGGVTTAELFGSSGTNHLLDAVTQGAICSTIDVMEATGNTGGVSEDREGITALLDLIDAAASVVATERGRLGAAQNRLEFTSNSLQISSENLSAAESRVRNTDMGAEMMRMTQANILQQAAISMLAQANMAPQAVLQLLG